MIFCTSDSYGAKLDESDKCFFAEGHKIIIEAISDSDRTRDPEGTKDKTVKIESYDLEGSQVEQTYYITSDYTVYGGSDSNYETAEIYMNSGALHRIVAGGNSGSIDLSQVNISGGKVDEIVPAEDGATISSYIMIGDEVAGPIDVWIGSEKDRRGSVSSVTLEAGENPNISLHVGYSDGDLISELNDSSEIIGRYINIQINGTKLNGLESFQKITGITINGEKNFLLDSGKGHFSKGEKTLRHSASFSEDSGIIDVSGFPKPEREGYRFKGWASGYNKTFVLDSLQYSDSGYLYAVWLKNTDTEPYNCKVTYYETGSDVQQELLVNFDYGSGSYIPKNFDKAKGLTLSGVYPDGTTFSKPIQDYEDGVWYCSVDSESINKTAKKTYVLDLIESDGSASEDGWGRIAVEDPDSYNEETGEYTKSAFYELNQEDALSKDGVTVELPYKAIQDKWNIRFDYQFMSENEDVGIKVGDQYVSDFTEEIKANGKTEMSLKYVLKTFDGKEHDLRINLMESDGSTAALEHCFVSIWNGTYDINHEKVYNTESVDLEKAGTAKGTEVVIPYTYESARCGDIELYYETKDPNTTVKGLNSTYTLDSNGERNIAFSVISANGKNTQKYKIKLVKDEVGDCTDLKYLTLDCTDWNTGENVSVPISLDAAKTNVGASVSVPFNVDAKSGGFWIYGVTQNYAVVDMTEEDSINWIPDIYKRPSQYNKKNDSVEFTVTSANGRNTQKYKVTVWQKDAKQLRDISQVKISGIENQEYTGSPVKQKLVLTDGNKTLVEGTDYTVAYKNNTKVGTASVVISGIGEYTGSVTKQFRIYKPGEAENDLFADSNTVRLAGSTRYETAVDTADALKKSLGVDKFDNIIVADGRNYPDALTGSYLAKVKNAPILLVNDSSASLIKDYIKRNLKSGGTVYILGGTGAVSSSFEKNVKNTGISVERLAGKTRYETNINILKESDVKKGNLLICSGKGFADSLSASAAGMPILLVGDTISPEQKAYMNGLSIDELFIIGGAGAVNASVESTAKRYGTVERLAGQSRYDTSVAVAKKFFSGETDTAVIAYGQNFPDGLAGGPLAMSLGAPLLLAENGSYNQAAGFVKSEGIQKGVVMGGTSLISNQVFSRIIN